MVWFPLDSYLSCYGVAASNISSFCAHSQLETELLRGSEQTVLDRPFRGIEDLAYGTQLQSLEMLQFKNHALAWRQSLQSA
jgi:hypothetical protein